MGETADESFEWVGHRFPRIDGRDKVTGRARYVDDLDVGTPLVAQVVRSQYPHARVVGIDDQRARAVPGVVGIISHLNVRKLIPQLAQGFDPACHDFERPVPFDPQPGDATIFDGVARFVGDPVAVVAARTREALDEAVELLDVMYDELPAVLHADAAGDVGAPLLHEKAAGNVASQLTVQMGDVDQSLASAASVIRKQFRTSKQKQAQMEPTGCVAVVVDDVLHVWSPHQSPHRARRTLAHLFDLPVARVRVIPPVIGGAFGKGDALTAEPFAVALALVTREPVKLVYSRTEDFVATESRHPVDADVEAGFDEQGRLVALRGRLVLDAGAYLSHTPRIATVMSKQLYDMYAVANVDLHVEARFTNLPVSGAFRGYGGPQAAYIVEHLIDLGAKQLGVDAIEARIAMLRDAEGQGDVSRLNVVACLDRGRQEFGGGSGVSAMPGRARGIGAACVNWKSGVADRPGALDRSSAAVRINEDASVDVFSGACDLGTGISTTLTQIAAEVLQLRPDSVRVTLSDTALTPFDSGAFSSRSLFRAGRATAMAAEQARDKVLAYAAGLLEVSTQDLEIGGGKVSVMGVPGRSLDLVEVLHRGLMERQDFNGQAEAPAVGARSACAQFAEVEVDLSTGCVEVIRLVAIQECGRAINPTIVEGQIEGGVYQGLGYALMEDMRFDDDTGSLLTGTFMDYRMPTVCDGPRIEPIIIEMPDAEGPYGAKGVAEPSIILTAPAVANAILDAIGECPTVLPMTPERVFGVLTAAAEAAIAEDGPNV